MFVGGLNWDTTDGTIMQNIELHFADAPHNAEGLKSYFEQFGKVEACTIMRDTETGRSRGFAFLSFEDGASVNAVLLQDHTLDGKAVSFMNERLGAI